MRFQPGSLSRCFLTFALSLLTCVALATPSLAQDPVTGAFEGRITNSQTGAPIAGAAVQFINQSSGVPNARRTDADGRFYQGLLQPGNYTIRVAAPGFKTKEIERRLLATQANRVIPVPIMLEPDTGATTPPTTTTTTTTTTTPPTTTGTTGTTTGTTGTTGATATTPGAQSEEEASLEATINQTDARRGGAFTELEVSTLPLGSTTLVRSFDELAFLVPGVFLPPQTGGVVAGPGVGPGVGSAGQFAVNGLRSRSNNFTVDGSDNNDEDIGVRRQGFLALVPQPIESIREYQIITLLAPAQFGRNIGAQVNAISKSGTSNTHGTIFGLFNSSQLNSRNFFDTNSNNTRFQLRSERNQPVFLDGSPLNVNFRAGGEDSFTLSQGGFVLGGPLDVDHGPGRPPRMFYFISAEGQILNASREMSFSVPTVDQRGAFRSGASGLGSFPGASIPVPAITFVPARCPGGITPCLAPPQNAFGFPTTFSGDAVFSLFPFPNNPDGVYGRNTFTSQLPASGQGKVVSGKFDASGKFMNRAQQFTARYNFTDDWRDVSATGGAIFSSLRPRVRTQNFSAFLNSELSDPSSANPVFNQLRFSYGRTRLAFDELRDTEFLTPSSFTNTPFLLNSVFTSNFTVPSFNPVTGTIIPNTGDVNYSSFVTCANVNCSALRPVTTEDRLGPVGQVRIAGFSPIGTDVFNFPQRRVNNTFQVADTMSWRLGNHSLAFGADTRRTELNSDLPRNSRPLLTFNGAPLLNSTIDLASPSLFSNFSFSNTFIRPETLAAAGAASGNFLSLASGSSSINLRYYQLNFFGQDEWRVRPNLSISYGLRYELNTVPHELNTKIEGTFNSPLLRFAPGLRTLLAGRTSIFDQDKNNFGPRVGFAWSPDLFGRDKTTVIRAGYGLFYDQILGSVVSQSRNVFPTFLTTNLVGGAGNFDFPFSPFDILSPSDPFLQLVLPGTVNQLDLVNFTFAEQIDFINFLNSASFGLFPTASGIGTTIPERNLKSPMAHHYSITFEQQLSRNMVVSAAYVGTLGRSLLRLTTPNLGPNAVVGVVFADPAVSGFEPSFFGLALPPGVRTSGGRIVGGRPLPGVGAVELYTSDARSRYDALQLQARGRLSKAFQYQVNYTFSSSKDDVSDVFDLAGASALPQNSLTFAGEYAPANFDARHRISYDFIYDLPRFANRDKSDLVRLLFGDIQIAGTGFFQTGQPFTVNSIFDVNLDGNLTDRPNTLAGITRTGDRSRPYTVSNPLTLLAQVGSDGSTPRNSLRAGSVMELNLSVIKRFKVTEQQNLMFRMDIFNFTDRANFGIPVRFLEDASFGRATNTVTPGRRVQFALKYNF
jgi:hypothetical protein